MGKKGNKPSNWLDSMKMHMASQRQQTNLINDVCICGGVLEARTMAPETSLRKRVEFECSICGSQMVWIKTEKLVTVGPEKNEVEYRWSLRGKLMRYIKRREF